MKKTFFVFLIFIASCGYQPVYLNKNLKNLEFKKIIFEGEKDINQRLINILTIKENDQSEDTLLISSSSKIEETSKDSKGQIRSLKTIILIKLKIKDTDNKLIKDKNFLKEFSKKNKKNKYELVEYQNDIKLNLVDKISNEINFYLNLE